MTIAELNKNVIKLWGESKYESHTVGRLAPLLYPSNTNLHAPIVALGLNPSFGHVDSYNRLRDTKEMEIRRLCAEIGLDLVTDNEMKEHLGPRGKDQSKAPKDEKILRMEKAFQWQRNDQERQDAQIRLITYLVNEARTNKIIAHFKPFQLASQFAFGTLNDWVHLDLLYWHRTVAFDVKEWTNLPSGKGNKVSGKESRLGLTMDSTYNDFAREQLALTLGILKSCDPQIVVTSFVNVVEFLMSKTMKDLNGNAELVKLDSEKFQKNGCDTISLNGKDIPLLMISHQGNKLFDRNTAWHISQIISRHASS